MERKKELMEKYQKITDVETALPIRVREKALFERLVDNQFKYLAEAGGTFSGDMAALGQILVPVFRRAFPMMIGKDIVGVQPMSQPTGYAFALRYHYVGNTTGNGANRVIGGASDHPLNTAYNWNPSDKQRNTANSLLLIYASTVARQVDCPDVNYGGTPAAATGDLAGKVTVIYSEENKAVVRVVSPETVATIKALVGTTGITIVEAVDNEAGYLYILKNYNGPLATLTGEQLGNDMDELAMTIDKIAIEAQTRKLKARYTLEAAQDLKAIHGKDMTTELIDILTYEIAQGIDRNIIDIINSQATASTFNMMTADGRWQMEKFRVVYTELLRKSNDIARSTLRGPGNFVISAPDVVTMVEQIPTFTGIAPIPGTIDSALPVNQLGQAMVGTIGGRFTVYRDIFATTNYATVGFKGVSAYDAGVIWSPYVPVQMKETIDPESGNPNIIFMERSAISANIFAADRFYRQITFSNLFA